MINGVTVSDLGLGSAISDIRQILERAGFTAEQGHAHNSLVRSLRAAYKKTAES